MRFGRLLVVMAAIVGVALAGTVWLVFDRVVLEADEAPASKRSAGFYEERLRSGRDGDELLREIRLQLQVLTVETEANGRRLEDLLGIARGFGRWMLERDLTRLSAELTSQERR